MTPGTRRERDTRGNEGASRWEMVRLAYQGPGQVRPWLPTTPSRGVLTVIGRAGAIPAVPGAGEFRT